MDARSHQRGGGSTSGEISQLLLIVSDGRGLFLEGMEAVKSAVRQAMEANVFVVFVVIDNPNNKVCDGHFVFFPLFVFDSSNMKIFLIV